MEKSTRVCFSFQLISIFLEFFDVCLHYNWCACIRQFCGMLRELNRIKNNQNCNKEQNAFYYRLIVLYFYTFLLYHNSNWFICLAWKRLMRTFVTLIRDQFSPKLFAIFTEFIIFTCYFSIGRKRFLNAPDVIILRSSCAIERPTTMNK